MRRGQRACARTRIYKLSPAGTADLHLSKFDLAVKKALATQHNIAQDRLANDGFGASRPVESNDTLEGRARNRRLELVRQ
jgi:hypothetical protein